MKELLTIEKITFSTGAGGRRVSASGILEAGGVLQVRGPSGAGKTTLLRILARLREAESGTMSLLGEASNTFSPAAWRRRVHYLAQKPVIFDGSVLDNLKRPFELASVKKDLQFDPGRARDLLRRLLLSAGFADQDSRTISGGEASRMALVRALLAEPQVILMDEPLAALDSASSGEVLGVMAEWVLAAPGRGIILVSHVGELSGLPGIATLDLDIREGGVS